MGREKRPFPLQDNAGNTMPLELFMLIPRCISLVFLCATASQHFTFHPAPLCTDIHPCNPKCKPARLHARKADPSLPSRMPKEDNSSFQQASPHSEAMLRADALRGPTVQRSGAARPRGPGGQLGGAARPTLDGARRQRLEQPGVDSRGCLCCFVSLRVADPSRPDAAPLRRAVSEVGLGLKGEKERAEKLQQAAVGDKGVQQVYSYPNSAQFGAGWIMKSF